MKIIFTLLVLILAILVLTTACSTNIDKGKTEDISSDVDKIGEEINNISIEDGFDDIDNQFNLTIE